jgi:hypothetical protein
LVTTSTPKYPRGKHPNSLLNLTERDGRPLDFEQRKKNRSVTLTDKGWEGLKQLAEDNDCKGISDLLDRLGRGEFSLSDS